MARDDDAFLNDDVVDELKGDPAVDSSRIAIAVDDGVVTLSGAVPSYWQKMEAANTVRRVIGVRAVANDLKVELPSAHVRNDTDIAAAAATALSMHSDLPDKVQATVDNGWVTLTGKVDWHFQRTVAEDAVRDLRGVRGVINRIELEEKPKAADVRGQIRQELARTVNKDVNNIEVETSDGHVTLRGTVRSWIEDEAARRASWSVPGVTKVEDRLVIG
ncbi:BON domain-containing protein [Mycobacterium sp.]|uniref:BON domain-containing protein n=1 Tax=Mycobacterium sp. TaxID=1785 RepID=UPI002C7AE45F|nr:BON domain-containing protein [Mycobacterium sp.]HTY30920.1 BON domain-containing protein [Mycobacterium sp.]